jgi:hypothetical protein
MGMLTIYAGREDVDREAFMFSRIGERLDALERGLAPTLTSTKRRNPSKTMMFQGVSRLLK